MLDLFWRERPPPKRNGPLPRARTYPRHFAAAEPPNHSAISGRWQKEPREHLFAK
jgi:hypothetical protein